MLSSRRRTAGAPDKTEFEVLVARLLLQRPGLHSVAVTPVSGSNRGAASDVCLDLAGAFRAMGSAVRIVEFGSSNAQEMVTKSETPVVREVIKPEMSTHPQKLRESLNSFDGITVVCGGPLLESGPSLIASAVADGVVVVVLRGKTLRSDLDRARAIVSSAGGTILGGILRG